MLLIRPPDLHSSSTRVACWAGLGENWEGRDAGCGMQCAQLSRSEKKTSNNNKHKHKQHQHHICAEIMFCQVKNLSRKYPALTPNSTPGPKEMSGWNKNGARDQTCKHMYMRRGWLKVGMGVFDEKQLSAFSTSTLLVPVSHTEEDKNTQFFLQEIFSGCF